MTISNHDGLFRGGIRAVAVGNGTARREAESFVREALKLAGLDGVPAVMASESGASIYSASEVAREEHVEDAGPRPHRSA